MGRKFFTVLLALFGACLAQLAGHLRPLGQQRPSEGLIETVHDFPEPPTFFEKYLKPGKPVLFKNVAKNIPAFSLWTDDYMRNKFGDVTVEVEEGKKENRSLSLYHLKMAEFLKRYKTDDIYLVQSLPQIMRDDLMAPPCISCGGFDKLLIDVIMWFSSGGTKSVLHNDNMDNINCLFSGKKLMWMADKMHEKHIPFDNPRGHCDVDVDAVDLLKYPGLAEVPWYEAAMETGDCLFIPWRWYHQVQSFPGEDGRNMAVNIWFYHTEKINVTDCKTNADAGNYVPLNKHTLRNPKGLRHILGMEVESLPLSRKSFLQRLRAVTEGPLDALVDAVKFLDKNQDKQISLEEVMDLSDGDLEYLLPLFPTLLHEGYGGDEMEHAGEDDVADGSQLEDSREGLSPAGHSRIEL